MSYEKDKLDSYVTSGSLSTALGPYITSASVSAAIAGINLTAYVTSNSLSAAVATNTLTVRGAGSVSATLSAGAVTVAGRPVGTVLLGYQAITGTQSVGFSGSWSDYAVLEMYVTYRTSATKTVSLAIFTDGGGTPFNSLQLVPVATPSQHSGEIKVFGGNATGSPLLNFAVRSLGGGATSGFTATANTGFVNCIRMTMSGTMSSGMAVLLGVRSS